MLFKTLTWTLALLVVAEGGYIFLHRHPINRFKPVDDYGYAAFDTATGQLCRTFRTKSVAKGIRLSPSPDRSPESRSGDRILDAIRNGSRAQKHAPAGLAGDDPDMAALHAALANAPAEENAQVEFVRGLPACADIR